MILFISLIVCTDLYYHTYEQNIQCNFRMETENDITMAIAEEMNEISKNVIDFNMEKTPKSLQEKEHLEPNNPPISGYKRVIYLNLFNGEDTDEINNLMNLQYNEVTEKFSSFRDNHGMILQKPETSKIVKYCVEDYKIIKQNQESLNLKLEKYQDSIYKLATTIELKLKQIKSPVIQKIINFMKLITIISDFVLPKPKHFDIILESIELQCYQDANFWKVQEITNNIDIPRIIGLVYYYYDININVSYKNKNEVEIAFDLKNLQKNFKDFFKQKDELYKLMQTICRTIERGEKVTNQNSAIINE
ncbi:uncharacterized protein VNE69_08044 [Vairimorpha necatrix]|uniref:Uncharacterized protein n=1 Tax=Vairimorpha necatrix TaxID=6039 RepID=A0AAX4JE59_9MICR